MEENKTAPEYPTSMVTISLDEYRDLVASNAARKKDFEHASMKIWELTTESNRLRKALAEAEKFISQDAQMKLNYKIFLKSLQEVKPC